MAKATTPDRSALEKVLEWAKSESEITLESDGTLVVAGDRPLRLTVTADEERIQVTHHHREDTEASARFEEVRHNLPRRGSPVTGTVAAGSDSLEATFTATMYIDGMTRQGFVTAIHELVAAVDRAIGDIPAAAPAPSAGPAPKSTPAPTSGDTDTAETPVAAPAERATDAAATMVLSSVWVPTHRIPDGGLRAWPKPDPATDPIATLQARVELSIAEHRGDWARVVGSNGWTGWVDARRLLPLTAAPTAGRRAAAGFPLGAIGAAAVILAAFLPWFSFDGVESVNAFDISLSFLWNLDASGDPMLGLAIAGAGALGLVAALLPLVPDSLRRLAGGVALAAAGAYTLQIHRGLGAGFGDTVDTLGIGVLACLAGAILLMAAPRGKG